METKDMEMLAKGLAQGLKPRLDRIDKSAGDSLDLIEDLQDRVAKLEALVAQLTAG
ncbi:hypothetical protein P0Y43_26180 [Pseudomonas entomophila]|uniref:hypothetical protein n=1 Tax=Pseudomonas entomophila TaxID=312306 RepID=UPI0023D8ACB1|nr:hypothetical protein [Pseudomonas entomophila]MDF0734177.1 hypothetical protein [Pseudomonas entomophila]